MKKLDIIYEDREIIVINKPCDILTISDGKTNNTLYHEVREYEKKKNPKNKIFIVHRLDKDTSGVIVFAKNEKTKRYLQDNWNDLCLTREYVAIVEGVPKNKKGKLVNYLKENKSLQVYVTDDEKKGKLAITNYEIIKTNKKYSMLKIIIETGRKNQIRAQLSFIGHPIVGDKKYNAKENPINRLGLHATKVELKFDNKEMKFESSIPNSFKF